MLTIIGSLDGRTVASEKTDSQRTADKVAASWKDSGLEVTVEEKSTRQERV